MTRQDAMQTIYKVINSGILDLELENDLVEVCNCIEDNNFEEEAEEI